MGARVSPEVFEAQREHPELSLQPLEGAAVMLCVCSVCVRSMCKASGPQFVSHVAFAQGIRVTNVTVSQTRHIYLGTPFVPVSILANRLMG